ncbi:hypothetical protein NL676_019119 [Syzygium grande]|nr:hypothetical protein NL676_019119 [Syzygium grande]
MIIFYGPVVETTNWRKLFSSGCYAFVRFSYGSRDSLCSGDAAHLAANLRQKLVASSDSRCHDSAWGGVPRRDHGALVTARS